MKAMIVGCGGIANLHAEIIKELGNEIEIVVDRNLESAKNFSTKWSANSYTDDFKKALEKNVDVVHICTPPMLHFEMVKEALLNNKNIICEKPLCIFPKDAEEILELTKKKNLIAAVNFNVRFHEMCLELKKQVHKDEVGDIFIIHGSYQQEFHILPTEYMWRYVEEIGGPMRATTEIGSHWIDLVRFVTDLEIEEVSATFGKFNKTRYVKDKIMYPQKIINAEEITVNSEDAAIVSIRFSNGSIGNLLLSEVSHGKSNEIIINIIGNKKSLSWNSERPYNIEDSKKAEGTRTITNAFVGGFPDTFKAFFSEVYEDIKKKEVSINKNYADFSDGYKNSKVCYAIYESANQNGKWIKI